MLLLPLLTAGQNTCGFNAGFENGDFTGWTASTGTCVQVNCQTFVGVPGVVPPGPGPWDFGRQVITSVTSGYDKYSCYNVPQLCPWGGNYSMRLGNEGINYETEDIQYTYTVSAATPILMYAYAPILEDPYHVDSLQPAFKTYIKDQSGNIIPCTYFKVTSTSMRGFSRCINQWGCPVWYFGWRNQAIDLSAYAGQQVTLYFQTNDCGLGAHAGYAYIDVIGCFPKQINLGTCLSPASMTLSAPQGFATYVWSNGMTTQSIQIDPRIVTSISCMVTSLQGCSFTITTNIRPNGSVLNFTSNIVCVCRGPTIFVDQSIYNSVTYGYYWSFGDGTSANGPNPLHQYAAAGNYTATMNVTLDNGCSYSVTRPVTVKSCPRLTPISHN